VFCGVVVVIGLFDMFADQVLRHIVSVQQQGKLGG
jgi:hypothetical protein